MHNTIQKLSYRMSGNGHPVVFLHGFLESSTMWNTLDLSLIPIQCIKIDLPGHGASALEDDQIPSITYMAKAVIRTLEYLGINHCSIVGHSMGGYVALEMMSLGFNIDRLVLFHSSFWSDSKLRQQDRVRVADLVFKAKSLFLQQAIPNLFYNKDNFEDPINQLIKEANEMEAMNIAYASLAMRNRSNHTALIQMNASRTFVIQGLNDPVVLQEDMVRLLPEGVRYYELNECGHMGHIEKPTDVISVLTEIFE